MGSGEPLPLGGPLNANAELPHRLLVGIDVGGTFTDAVAVRGGEVLATAKALTEPEHLERSLLGALDGILNEIDPGEVTRVSLSTTLITNLIAQGRVPEVALLLIPGPGRNPADYRLPARVWTVGGAVDFRGRVTEPLDRAEIETALEQIQGEGLEYLGVVGKFSPRNPTHEQQVAAWAAERDGWQVKAGHSVAGQLNFPRRAAATALTLAVERPYRAFFAELRSALQARGLDCPLVVLKADGGTLPLEVAEQEPLHSIFSGPAASTMGALALRPPDATSVVVDVGGTTTDLALVLDGDPVYASMGAELEGYPLPVRAFAVRSLPVGGDSTLTLEEGRPVLLATRAGVAASLGGPAPTLTDALRVLGHSGVGDPARAREALAALGEPEAVARTVVDQALERIHRGIEAMFEAWRREPVYRLWQLRRKRERRPDVVVGLGAAADALVPLLGERMEAEVVVPPYAPVANALGAAVARTTYTTTLHVDTEQRSLEVLEAGRTEPLPAGRYTLEDVRELARSWMARRGEALGIEAPLADAVEVLAEQFNVVEGWRTVGRIFDVRWERPAGLVEAWREKRDEG